MSYNPLTWDWLAGVKAIIAPFFGAGFATALIQVLIPFLRDWQQRKSNAAYMAMRLAVNLEAFASACGEFISDRYDIENKIRFDPPGDEQTPGYTTKLPELSPYPDDPEGWRAINPELAGQCLNLRNRIRDRQSTIDTSARVDPGELGDTLDIEAARCGSEALNLATALRRKHGKGDAKKPVVSVWDYRGPMEALVEMHQERKRDSAKRVQAMLKDRKAPHPPTQT